MRMETLQSNKTIGRIIRAALLAGIVYFGFVFPDSLSDHQKILHFSAHVGMSFLLATCIYVICNMVLHMSRKRSLIVLSILTLLIGALYKYLEISSQGIISNYSLGELIRVTGCYTSMSQNTAGLLAAILLIEYSVQYFRVLLARRPSL
ncbi:MAG: hypothetical protein JST68_23085 [Bacteroidetes bacterium]|nr:hypothetical protein [Bacteroidota bacterium]